jgi:ferredoxin-thioredoxin reductase catalytic chain
MGDNDNNKIEKNRVDNLFSKLSSYKPRGYYLNSDEIFAKAIIKGLLFNETRYGYQSCPCRLASGDKIDDLDIICPCNYRDADIAEYGSCSCGLYVSKKNYDNKFIIKSIPERRPSKELRNKLKNMEN